MMPKVVITIDFTELAKFIASTGLIITAVRCSYCNGRIGLPEKGDITKCLYCNSVIKAIDVYKIVKDLLKGFTKRRPERFSLRVTRLQLQ